MNELATNSTVENTLKKHTFYIVSLEKFLILFIGTMGLYLFYWFYKHYSLYLRSEGTTTSPIIRELMAVMVGGLLSIFFVHQIFTAFEKQAKVVSTYKKSLGTFVVLYIVIVITGNILPQFLESDLFSSLILFIKIFTVCWVLFNAQKVANIACQDSNGTSNTKLTPVNYFWLLIGSVLWLTTLLDSYTTFQNISS